MSDAVAAARAAPFSYGSASRRCGVPACRMIPAKERLDHARRVLGSKYRYAFTQADSDAPVQNWMWDCGCILQCSGSGRNGTIFSFAWTRCGGHLQSAEIEPGSLR